MRVLALVLFWTALASAQCPVSDTATCAPGTLPAPATVAKPAAVSGPQAATEETITRIQADAILVELKEIHALLKKQQPAEPIIDMTKIDFNSFPVVKLPSDRRRDNAMGKDDAPVTMVEFSDYQCEHCARFHRETLAAIKSKYIDTGKVRFVSRDLPLKSHPWAMAAAEASRCAGDQGKYWEMRDALMQHASEMSASLIDQLARSLIKDMNLYRACTESRKYYADVKADIEAAMAVQIPATPGFVIGRSNADVTEGTRVLGAYPIDQFEKFIDQALNAHP